MKATTVKVYKNARGNDLRNALKINRLLSSFLSILGIHRNKIFAFHTSSSAWKWEHKTHKLDLWEKSLCKKMLTWSYHHHFCHWFSQSRWAHISCKKKEWRKTGVKTSEARENKQKNPLYTDDERLYNQLNHQHHSYCYPCNQPRTFIYTANHHHHHCHHYHHHHHHHHHNNNQLYLTRVTRDSTSTE